jgi:hypothetical protein
MKIFRLTLWIQSLYYLITAVWPLVDIKSFMLITGCKHDVWLVKTVGALLIPVSLTMFSHLFFKVDHRPVFVLCVTAAIAFASIDFYYSLTDVISNIYMVDGVIQICLIVAWTWIILRERQ